MIPVTYQIPAATLLAVGGLVSCFAGYRFFRVVLVLYGFALGALIATSLVGAGSTAQLVMAAAAGGLVGALILYFAYFVGVALLGAAIAALGIVPAIWAQLGRDPHPLVVILFSLAGAAAAIVLQRYVIIIATAVVGAWAVIVGALALTGDARGLEAASRSTVWIIYPVSPQPEDRWLAIAWWLLGISGMLIQLGVTGRGRPRPKSWKAKTKRAQAA